MYCSHKELQLDTFQAVAEKTIKIHSRLLVMSQRVIIGLMCFQLFVAMSVLGTVFRGYFFAFHLLNIVNNNQLLKGVIQAVTQNGHCCRLLLFYFCHCLHVVKSLPVNEVLPLERGP